VRDAALKVTDELPKSIVNREYFNQQAEKQMAESGDNSKAYGELGKITGKNEMLAKLARKAPYYKRNRPHVCSFWAKGECKRGEECPYRHEAPTDPDDPLSNQNIRDRFYGTNDPVADKIFKRMHDITKDEKIKSGGPRTSSSFDRDERDTDAYRLPTGLPPALPKKPAKKDTGNNFFNLS